MKFFTIFAVGLLVSGAANASTFTFDGFAHSDNVNNVVSEDGLVSATVTATGGVNEAWAFDTSLSGTNDSDLEGPFSHYLGGAYADLVAGRALIIQEDNSRRSGHDGEADDNAGGGTITFLFGKAVDFLGFDLLDDGNITVSSTSTASTYNASLPVPGADGKYGSFLTGTTFFGVTDLTFTLNHSGAIDSLRFVTPVPVPAALPMLLAGLGGFGIVRRRKRRT